ncbi:PoNe immunity protein domain-containing protein [Pseudomonas fontis]|uniref:PoNi-like cognate immunity protein n=1 Tax=Pseudomonas fontis TaxID=2942633 RepID=A0ABT5NTP5_9PSED|nr:PoNe immunity protein domain-containing protein [Pseudomonas fontis]MDD0976097.1 PoNi-like cognate immunity protein [Pseudomonas fontis]MDD0991547.1 PoNi-like cognate immunity protein [Pseudomonas fontis]
MTDFDKTKREPLLVESDYLDSLQFKQEHYINQDLAHILSSRERTYSHEKGLSWDWAFESFELLMLRYSGGDPVADLLACANHAFDQFVRHKLEHPEFSLSPWEPDAYQYILWLISLAVLLDMNERAPQIANFINVSPGDGLDSLLCAIFSRVGVELPIGERTIKKPFNELQAALNSSGDEQQQLMSRYLRHWYPNMKNCYWHGRDKVLDSGFFGYWAFEAAMVTILWDIDDTVYRDLPYYPKDLVDYARAKHVADHFPQGRLIGAPGMTAKSGEECPCTGVWTCDDWAVGPQTFSRGITLPTDSGRQVTWRLTKVI